MQIYRGIPSPQHAKNTIVTLGTFDGVHLGHRSIISRVKEKAAELDGFATIVTFEPHPQLVLLKKDRPKIQLLTTVDEKLAIFEKLGVDIVVVLQFDKDLASIPAAEFVEKVFYQGLGARYVVMGYDHNFGNNREGNTRLLEKLGAEFGFEVESVGPVTASELVISSTKIRHYLNSGEVANAAHLLHRNYRICGTVVQGDGRGRSLGFPTANIQPVSKHKVIPADGIYAVLVHLDTARYKGLLNIGDRPTFSNTSARTIEAHLFDFEGDLYTQSICVEFVGRIREEMQFASSDELTAQIKEDLKKSAIFFENFERSL